MRTIAAVLAPMLLAACAMPQPSARSFDPYAPLDTYIQDVSAGRPQFYVNRPAYVALFLITPGQGPTLLYPGLGSGSLDGRVFAGSSSVSAHFALQQDAAAARYAFARMPTPQPRYYFMIASERPLDVRQFQLRTPLSLSFSAISPYQTMEQIAGMALPSLVDDGSWATDMYVEWPNVLYDRRDAAPGLVQIRCGGYAMWVARAYAEAATEALCRAAEDEKSTVAKPGRRGPQPIDSVGAGPGRRQAITERVAASRQLSERQAIDDASPRRARPAGVEGDDRSARARSAAPGREDVEGSRAAGRSGSSTSATSASGEARAKRSGGESTTAPAPRPQAMPAGSSSGKATGSGAVGRPVRGDPGGR